jgi:hypothetical protein
VTSTLVNTEISLPQVCYLRGRSLKILGNSQENVLDTNLAKQPMIVEISNINVESCESTEHQ